MRITKKLVEAHGGTNLFERDEYDGTTIVKIYLKMMVELVKEIQYDQTKVIDGKYVKRYLGARSTMEKSKTFSSIDIGSFSILSRGGSSVGTESENTSDQVRSSDATFSRQLAKTGSFRDSTGNKSSSSLVAESLDQYLKDAFGVFSSHSPKTPGNILISDSVISRSEEKNGDSQNSSGFRYSFDFFIIV